MSRRANGEGSIYRRKDGRWVASLSSGRGTRRHFLARTREEASRKLTVALKSRDDGLSVITERQTFAEFAARWLKAVKPSLKPLTWIRYEQLIRVHALPAFGARQLTKITPSDLQALYADVAARGGAPASIRQLHAVLHRCLRQAHRWNVIARNVADLVTPPRVSRQEIQALSPNEARTLLRQAEGNRLEALYVLAVTTGMRQGELLGLQWKDLDLERGTLHVRRTLHPMTTGFIFTEPKTTRSRRQIVVTTTATSALKRHRVVQAEERLRAGPAWNDQDMVFATLTGGPLTSTTVLRQEFYPLLESAGLPKIRFHDLRHTAATLLLTQGIHPKIVSEMLGHSNIAITMDLYSHVTPTMQREAAAALDNLLSGS